MDQLGPFFGAWFGSGRVAIPGVIFLAVIVQYALRWLSEERLGDVVLMFNVLAVAQAITLIGTAISLGRSWEAWQAFLVGCILVLALLSQWATSKVFRDQSKRWREFIGDELKRCAGQSVVSRCEPLIEMGTRAMEVNFIPDSLTQTLERKMSDNDSSPRQEQRSQWLKFLNEMGYLNPTFADLSHGELVQTDLFMMSEARRRRLGRRYQMWGYISLGLLIATALIVSFIT